MAVIGLILAGGLGTRMKISGPKSMQLIAGKPMVSHIIQALKNASIDNLILVLGEHNHDKFSQVIAENHKMAVVLQESPQGTAHASACAAALFDDRLVCDYCQPTILKSYQNTWQRTDNILICLGDTPALSSSVIKKFIQSHDESDAVISIMALSLDDPYGYGRIILNEDQSGKKTAKQIVEQKNCSKQQQKINLCFCGLMIARLDRLFQLLKHVKKNELTKEYYLTELVELAYKRNYLVNVMNTNSWQSFLGVNTQAQKKKIDGIMSSSNSI